MKNISLCFLFYFLAIRPAIGQSSFPPVYEIRSDSGITQLDDTYWQMLEDSSGIYTIDVITTLPLSEKFHINNSKGKGVGYSSVHEYWQRARIKNSAGKDIKIIFNCTFESQIDVFIYFPDGKQEHHVTGWKVPLNKRDTLFRTKNAIDVNISNGQEVMIYKKVTIDPRRKSNVFSFSLMSLDNFVKAVYIDESDFTGDTWASFIAGMLVLAFFINLFFFRIVKEKIYIYYAFFLLFEGLWYLTQSNSYYVGVAPEAYDYINYLLCNGACFFSVTQFVRHFLKTYKFYPYLDKAIIVLIIAHLFYFNSSLFTDFFTSYEWRGLSSLIQGIIFGLLMVCLLIAFILPQKEKDKFTTLSIIAAIPVFLVWTCLYTLASVYQFLYYHNNIQQPSFVRMLLKDMFYTEMICVGWFVLLFSWILLQKYALLRKQLTLQALEKERERSELMKEQKIILENQVEERTAALKQSIEELKSTQNQLIQSEKMASLGELTAGIAHEIQNPLNFVNNFSEVNKELLVEMKEEIEKGNMDEVKAIANDVIDNEEKINHHGKRADAIVKGMLQHSRSSSGVKEPTDINALADEYLRLAYHGLRAKDKSFNATMKTDFDESIGNINIIPQDIGRVILNLITNAFYVVDEKKTLRQAQGDNSYEPTVSVTTKKIADKVEIKVADNGNGIPQKVLEKIFQPFFTTKPTGQGTGLGLSLSYDIVKAHGGELNVETKEGEGCEFIISLPV